MSEKIQSRIKALAEFLEILDAIGVSNEWGAGLTLALQNEMKFLKELSLEIK